MNKNYLQDAAKVEKAIVPPDEDILTESKLGVKGLVRQLVGQCSLSLAAAHLLTTARQRHYNYRNSSSGLAKVLMKNILKALFYTSAQFQTVPSVKT